MKFATTFWITLCSFAGFKTDNGALFIIGMLQKALKPCCNYAKNLGWILIIAFCKEVVVKVKNYGQTIDAKTLGL